MRLAVVVSQFNEDITSGLEQGAYEYLAEEGVDADSIDRFSAPGAFEIPLIAQALAESGRYQGVICLGCVIKGDTAHFEFISLGAAWGIQSAMLSTKTPMSFGILTTYTDEQAEQRSQPDSHNKGREAAAAVVEALKTLRQIQS